MRSTDILTDAFNRVGEGVARLLDGLDDDALVWRPDPRANTVAWLVWHIGRGIDAQVAEVAATDEVWTSGGWADRFALPFDDGATGYGQSADDVGRVRASAELLRGYVDATQAAALAYLATLTDDALDRVVDERWDPPVTLGVRLVSVVGDATQHLGQASYVKGLRQRATS
ncbi:mycothiol transferase [Luteimicrobium sp. DT211]|uniref:mycothiol transferase n=1 Tax=Luteimicrobium sp. DT211 TaxID=3393412 RepID=UPI003CF1F463